MLQGGIFGIGDLFFLLYIGYAGLIVFAIVKFLTLLSSIARSLDRIGAALERNGAQQRNQQ